MVETNLVSSKSEARRLVEQNGISINHTFESIYNFENIDDYILDSYIKIVP